MTRCMRKEVNLKSSTYNQTGERYLEQLAAYNSMSIHLRRILSAKSVIDTRNKNYLLKKHQPCKVQETGDKRVCSHPAVIDDVINRLAYDTLHHPMFVVAERVAKRTNKWVIDRLRKIVERCHRRRHVHRNVKKLRRILLAEKN